MGRPCPVTEGAGRRSLVAYAPYGALLLAGVVVILAFGLTSTEPCDCNGPANTTCSCPPGVEIHFLGPLLLVAALAYILVVRWVRQHDPTSAQVPPQREATR